MIAPAGKAALRAALRERRRQRPAAELAATGTALARVAEAKLRVLSRATVALYAATAGEPPTGELCERLRAAGVRVLLPVPVPGDGQLRWAELDGPLRPGPFGIPVPAGPPLAPAELASADLALVPALAVDAQGHRLGRGGGHYDRALALAPDVAAYAVVFDDEVLDALPTDPWDRPVRGALTPTRVLALPR